jgi:hypothetical protein
MSSMGYPHPIKGMGGDELLSKTQLMFGRGIFGVRVLSCLGSFCGICRDFVGLQG